MITTNKMRIEINEYIVIDSEICHGKPTFKGTRVMVSTILEMLEAGAPIEEIIDAYPSITPQHVKASLKFAAKVTEKNLLPI
tara:strand:+ start:324 stop:569 length:246 start_codon:yes stop_codon:yes gene_type:complete